MKCSNCGKELKEDAKFCGECGQKVEETTTVEETRAEENKEVVVEQVVQGEKRIVSFMENDAFFCTLSMILYFGSGIIEGIIYSISEALGGALNLLVGLVGLCPLVGIGLCIYARVKYPNSKFAKILLIVYIVLFVLAIIAFVLIVLLCATMFRNCPN